MASNRSRAHERSTALAAPVTALPCAATDHVDTRVVRAWTINQEVAMKHWIKLLTLVVAGAVLASIGAGLAFGSDAKSNATVVKVAKSPFGLILVDSKGITLYDFVKDKGTTSVCYGACAALWPPLITTAKPVAGSGVRASLLGTTKRKDGKLEVTYGGHPLYYFVTDRKPGQTTGQGVNQFGGPWWVISPAGKEIHHG
jgi:predicted lipoprotein with Yx(FWY)xxD motif